MAVRRGGRLEASGASAPAPPSSSRVAAREDAGEAVEDANEHRGDRLRVSEEKREQSKQSATESEAGQDRTHCGENKGGGRTPTTALRQLAMSRKRPMMALPMAAKMEAMAEQTQPYRRERASGEESVTGSRARGGGEWRRSRERGEGGSPYWMWCEVGWGWWGWLSVVVCA